MKRLLVVLLLLAPLALGAETIHVTLTVTSQARGALPDAAALGAGLARAFAESYGRFADLAFGASSSASDDEPNAAVTVDAREALALISTSLMSAHSRRSIDSTVPRGSPASLVATMSSDLAYLLFSSRGFSTLSLAAAPLLQATLHLDDLQQLTGWNLDDLEPLGLTSTADQLTLCFPHAYLTLGPLFTVTPATLRDIYAQSAGREKVQLSGIAASSNGETLLLLSESASSLVQVRPRIGTRLEFVSPGLSALAARALDENRLAALSNTTAGAGIAVYSLAAGSVQTFPVATSYASAFDVDREGNFWVWDATEHRIRILTPDGIEVGAIRPLLKTAIMQLPEQLEVFDDGSFLLGGSGEVWKFERTGIPDWRLTRIPGHPSEQLPASFDIAVDREDGSFTLLDEPSRRALSFSADSQTAAPSPPSPLVLLDEGTDADQAFQHIELLKVKSTLYAGYADSLARDLLFDRADGAYLRAGEAIRELAAESPGDADAAQLLASVVARRQEVRATLAHPSDIRADGASLTWQSLTPCSGRLILSLTVQNVGTVALSQVRVHAALPALETAPSLVTAESLGPGEQKDLEIPLGTDIPATLPGSTPASLFFTYDNGSESVSSALTVSAAVDVSTSATITDSLACAFTPNDPLIAGLPSQLVVAEGSPEPLALFMATLDALAMARETAPTTAAIGGTMSTRSVLRSLASNERGWVLIEAGVAAAVGMRVGFLSSGQAEFALIDTGVPLVDALSEAGALSRYRTVLSVLSRDGKLCLPVSGIAPTAGAPGSTWAVSGALEKLLAAGPDSLQVAWTDQLAGNPMNPPDPVPFPFVPPSPLVHASSESWSKIIDSIVEQKR